MLPPAALDAADRLIAILMTLVDAVASAAIARNVPTFPAYAAPILANRLIQLITTLIRISAFGIRAPAQRTAPARIHPAPTTSRPRPTQAQTLPRRPGWLLAALPGLAPAIAADLRALLADPALATFLAAAPTLHRTLRPLLRSLDLAAPQPPPPPRTPPPHHPPSPNPAPPSLAVTPRLQARRPKTNLFPTRSSHAHFITI